MKVIFDFDGTIADTMPLLSTIAATLLRSRYGLNPRSALTLYNSNTGATFSEQLQELFPYHKRNEETVTFFNDVKRLVYDVARPTPRARDVLNELRDRGIATAVVSSTEHDIVKAFITEHALPVDVVYGLHHPDLRSPYASYPGGLELSDKAEQLRVAAGKGPACFIGDSRRDAGYAREAQLPFAKVHGISLDAAMHAALGKMGALVEKG